MYFDTSTARSAEDALFCGRLARTRLRHGQIYLRGETQTLSGPTLGIVGSRDCSLAGAAFARQVGAEAARLGIAIVSGGARGIDSAAHAGALCVQGRAILVLAAPLENPSPLGTRRLAQAIVRARGLVLSEYADAEPVHRSHFLERNRIVAALADVLMVVDAHAQSGALATARHANKLGREVWVAPGAPWDQHADGSNALLVSGARPITSLAALGDALVERFGVRVERQETIPHLEALRTPRSLEEWRMELGLDIARACRLMFELNASGQVSRLPDGRYLRKQGAKG